MAKAQSSDEMLDADKLAHAEEVDNAWSPSRLTVLGFVTFVIAITIIVFCATRLTTCMYLDGSQ